MATPSGTSAPSGKGRLVIKLKSGSERGCLISNGRWYNTVVGSSCATFHASKSGETIKLRSSKGPCGIRNDEFSCGHSMSSSHFKVVDGKLVGANGSGSWSANGIPRGTKQQIIQASSGGKIGIEILWSA